MRVDVCESMILTPVSRIVGGQPAAQHAWPWQVGLVSRQKTTSPNTTTPFCGGSLVSRAAVVTAAHCEQRVARFLVVVGDHDLATLDQGQRSIEPESWVSHPNYDARCHEISSHHVCNLHSRTIDYDYAVIKLLQPVTFSASVAPVCLPPPLQQGQDRPSLEGGRL